MRTDPMHSLLELIDGRSTKESVIAAVRLEMAITKQADAAMRCVASVAVREILLSETRPSLSQKGEMASSGTEEAGRAESPE